MSFADVFSSSEIEAIRKAGEGQIAAPASVHAAPAAYRKCAVAWLEDAWLAEKLMEVTNHINAAFFGFELKGFGSAFQYTVYEPGEYYHWHMDLHTDRKLSLTVQLSHPEEYDGGDFEIQTGEVQRLPRGYGQVLAFPSWVLHRITPVTRGTRRSLVVWACGEPFK